MKKTWLASMSALALYFLFALPAMADSDVHPDGSVCMHTEDAWMLDVDGKAIFGDDVEALQGTARFTYRF